jgi:Glyoxalase-like domain
LRVDLAFQRVEDYRPPRWPDDEHPKQYHLDFEVDEIEPEQRRVVKLGATLQKDFIGPEGYGWQVYTDPVGHPFCLCRHKGSRGPTKGLWALRACDSMVGCRRPSKAQLGSAAARTAHGAADMAWHTMLPCRLRRDT